MMEAAQTPHATPMAHATTDPRNYTRVLGLTAGMFSLLHVLIAGSAAVSARPAIITLQRSLIDYAQGGGVSIDQLSDPLLRLFVVTYLSALISMLITLGFCWYAGRVAKENTGEARAAGRAGATVAHQWGGLVHRRHPGDPVHPRRRYRLLAGGDRRCHPGRAQSAATLRRLYDIPRRSVPPHPVCRAAAATDPLPAHCPRSWLGCGENRWRWYKCF